jgi:hypothetical protein
MESPLLFESDDDHDIDVEEIRLPLGVSEFQYISKFRKKFFRQIPLHSAKRGNNFC